MEDGAMKDTENELIIEGALKSVLSLKKSSFKKCPTVINSAKRFNEGNPGRRVAGVAMYFQDLPKLLHKNTAT